jgi:hypothetical protein
LIEAIKGLSTAVHREGISSFRVFTKFEQLIKSYQLLCSGTSIAALPYGH